MMRILKMITITTISNITRTNIGINRMKRKEVLEIIGNKPQAPVETKLIQ